MQETSTVHINIILLTSTSYSSLQTSYSTLPPHNTHQARYNGIPSNHYPQPACTVWSRSLRDGWRSGEVSRAGLPRKPCYGARSAGVSRQKTPRGKEEEERFPLFWIAPEEYPPRFFAGCGKPPVTVTRGGGVSAPDWRREVEHAQKGGGT